MSFVHASASKGLLLWSGVASFVGSIFGQKHLFHMQLFPHITKDHQLWRLVTRNLAFTSSIDFFISVLVIYNTSITLERRFGTAKFVSFAIISSIIGTALEVGALFLLHGVGLSTLPAGPYSLVFAVLYNYDRVVPATYIFKLFGATFSGKSLVYLAALQLVFSQPPNSMVSAACGLLAGALYRANFLGARQWRVPPWTQRLGSRLLMPLLASGRVPRRSTRTSLEDSDSGPASMPRPSAGTGPARGTTTARQGAISEVVQTFASTRSAGEPSADAIAQLQAMFPSASAEQVTAALQRGGNDINRSVEFLL